jgi:hypothetical protein
VLVSYLGTFICFSFSFHARSPRSSALCEVGGWVGGKTGGGLQGSARVITPLPTYL